MSEARNFLTPLQDGIHVRRPSLIASEDEDHVRSPSVSPKSSLLPQHHTISETIDDKPKSSIKTQWINENTIQLLLCIVGWYTFSLTISLYNKWMFDKSKLNFPFPILITSFHQLLLSLLSYITLQIKPGLKPSRVNNPSKNWKFYFTHIVPCSLASAGDIGAGNASFRFISLTTYTMVKSSSIAFVLLFGVIARLEKFSYHLLGIVLLMSFGVMLMVDKSDNSQDNNKYYILGFCLVLLSSCMSGLRWVFTQLLLHKNAKVDSEIQLTENTSENNESNEQITTPKKNPIFTIYQLSPPMFIILFIIGLFIEGLGPFLHAEVWEQKGIILGLTLLFIPGFLVFFMTFFEFGILQRAQVITLSIAGIFKELLTIVVSSFIFGDRLTLMNLFGLIITLIDIGWYNYYRYQVRLQEEAEEDAKKMTQEDFELENV